MDTKEKLKQTLADGIAVFEYTKAKGESRLAYGTLNKTILDNILLDSVARAGKRPADFSVAKVYYDLEANGWRTCRYDRLHWVATMEEYLDEGHSVPDKVMNLYQMLVVDSTFGEADAADSEGAPAETLMDRIHRDYPCPAAEDGFTIGQGTWDLLVRNILTNKPTLLTGPTGCGKTELVAFAAKRIGIPMRSPYDMGSMHDPLAQMLGTHRLAEGEKGTHSVFDYARFAREIQEPGIILLDELSRAPETTLNFLLPVLDNRRSLPVEAAGENDRRNILVHPDCVFIATANIGQEYVGTRALDPALQDRFIGIGLQYLNVDEESRLLTLRTGIRAATARKIAVAMNDIRRLRSNDEIEDSVSVRESLRVAELVRDGWDLLDAFEVIILPLFQGTDTEGNRGTVRKCILSR